METTLPRAVRKGRDSDEILRLARAGASAERCIRTFRDGDDDRRALVEAMERLQAKYLGKGSPS